MIQPLPIVCQFMGQWKRIVGLPANAKLSLWGKSLLPWLFEFNAQWKFGSFLFIKYVLLEITYLNLPFNSAV